MGLVLIDSTPPAMPMRMKPARIAAATCATACSPAADVWDGTGREEKHDAVLISKRSPNAQARRKGNSTALQFSCTAPCPPEQHWRLTVCTGTQTGKPARNMAMRHWGQDGETWSLELWPCQESSSSTGPQHALQSRAPAYLFGALGGGAQHAAKAHVPHSLHAAYVRQSGRSSSHAGWPAVPIPSVLHKRARRRSTPHPPPAPPPCGAACPASPHRPARWGGCLGSRPAVPCTAPCGRRRHSPHRRLRGCAARTRRCLCGGWAVMLDALGGSGGLLERGRGPVEM